MEEGNDNVVVKFENKKENIEMKTTFEEFKSIMQKFLEQMKTF